MRRLLYLWPSVPRNRPNFLEGGLVTDKIVILVTAASRRECRKIARHLIEARLAACVNITQPIESLYRWEGKIADDDEFLMLIKSTRELFPKIKKEISRIHSYHTPEIICLPIIDGSRNYLQWVTDSLKKTPGERG
jgi:periplasmic divalent cation tolerance protein